MREREDVDQKELMFLLVGQKEEVYRGSSWGVSNRNDGSTGGHALLNRYLIDGAQYTTRREVSAGRAAAVLSPSLTNGWLIRSPPPLLYISLTRNWFDAVLNGWKTWEKHTNVHVCKKKRTKCVFLIWKKLLIDIGANRWRTAPTFPMKLNLSRVDRQTLLQGERLIIKALDECVYIEVQSI